MQEGLLELEISWDSLLLLFEWNSLLFLNDFYCPTCLFVLTIFPVVFPCVVRLFVLALIFLLEG